MKNTFFEKRRQEKMIKSSVFKAFLITEGSKKSRGKIVSQMCHDDKCLMSKHYEGENATAIIFSDENSDFIGMTFAEAARLAGDNELGADFRAPTFGNEEKFGTIKLPSQTASCRM